MGVSECESEGKNANILLLSDRFGDFRGRYSPSFCFLSATDAGVSSILSILLQLSLFKKGVTLVTSKKENPEQVVVINRILS